ncbi:MAG: cellulase N-terminal Ig-like domain-containing protein, partial [Rhodanobacteraceae bacterium]
MKSVFAVLLLGCLVPQAAIASQPVPARILINQLGYEASGPKWAIVEGSAGDDIGSCSVRTFPDQAIVLEVRPDAAVAVDHWRDWRFSRIDFGSLAREGRYVIECRDASRDGARTLRSSPFLIQRDVLERHTLADVLSYFKASRVSGANDRADAKVGFMGDPDKPPIDARGGWYDATGDYGVHFSQLSYTSYFNTVQVPLVAYALGRTYELLKARNDINFTQIERHLIDGATYGADFLVRMHPDGGSF